MAIDRVTSIETRGSAALAWLNKQAAAGSDHKGISAVRQGIRKLDDGLAAEAAKMTWIEDALADHRSAQQAQPSASSQCIISFWIHGTGLNTNFPHRQCQLTAPPIVITRSRLLDARAR